MRRFPALVFALASAFGQTPSTEPTRAAPTRPSATLEAPVDVPVAAPAPPAADPTPTPAEPTTTAPEKKQNPSPSAPTPPPLPTREPAVAARETTAPAEPAAPAIPVKNWLEAQIELARRGFSCGSIDAAVGPKTRAALRAFQDNQDLEATGELDAATKERLTLSAPPFAQRSLSAKEIDALQPLSPTWLGKSEQTSLAYENALEAVSEKYHAHPLLIKKLNASLDWAKITAETLITVPAVERVAIDGRPARFEIMLPDCALRARNADGKIIAHFPVSIGRLAESRPVGELHITVVIPDPNYTFDPAVFPESAEARELGRKLILQPGPNNPVGVAWIGLDRPGYGIHGTPSPERIGSAESHGCFRMTNFDARTFLTLAAVGMIVEVNGGAVKQD